MNALRFACEAFGAVFLACIFCSGLFVAVMWAGYRVRTVRDRRRFHAQIRAHLVSGGRVDSGKCRPRPPGHPSTIHHGDQP